MPFSGFTKGTCAIAANFDLSILSVLSVFLTVLRGFRLTTEGTSESDD